MERESKVRVLLVDDNFMVRQTMRDANTLWGNY
jgi:hypothetical protein